MRHYLDFEKPIADIDARLSEINAEITEDNRREKEREAAQVQTSVERKIREVYRDMSPIQICMVARHPDRPHFTDYINELFTEQTLLAGDRKFADDPALLCYLARFRDQPVVVMGQEKGHDTRSRLRHNFGMARPEGYRKVVRLIDLASRFQLPVLCLVDTAGAYPGIGAEERGQSEAIATTIEKSLSAQVPIVSVITGEGGSGGAVALASSDRIAMLEYSVYSVISPEGCASILWKNADMKDQAAEALRLTASDMISAGVIDTVIKEPLGGAHRDHASTIRAVGETLADLLKQVQDEDPDTLLHNRHDKFLKMHITGKTKKRSRRQRA